jgi:hypothetical protein
MAMNALKLFAPVLMILTACGGTPQAATTSETPILLTHDLLVGFEAPVAIEEIVTTLYRVSFQTPTRADLVVEDWRALPFVNLAELNTPLTPGELGSLEGENTVDMLVQFKQPFILDVIDSKLIRLVIKSSQTTEAVIARVNALSNVAAAELNAPIGF